MKDKKYLNVMEKDWYHLVEQRNFLKYVLYSDSVAKNTNTIIKEDGIKKEISFDKLWNKLSKTNDIIYLCEKEYIYFNENIELMNYDIKIDSLIFTKPKYIMRHKINKNIFRLQFTNDAFLDTTKDHSLLDYDYKNHQMIKIKPTDASYISIIRNQNINFNINYDYLLYGLWFGDGTYSSCYPSISIDERDSVIKLLKNNCSGIKFYIDNTDDFGFSINYNPLKIFLESNNLKKKKSPDRILSDNMIKDFQLDKNKFFSFLIGYWTSDGSFSSGQVTFNSSNKESLKQIKSLLMINGIYSHIKIDINGRNYKGNVKGDMFQLSLIGNSEFLINELKKFEYVKNCQPLSMKSTYYGHGRSMINKQIVRKKKTAKLFNIKPMKIFDKKEIFYNDYVYDVEIDRTHNFVANGCVVHNTDSIMFQIPVVIEKIEEQIKVAHECALKINDLIIDYTKDYMLPRLGYSSDHNFTNFKEELLMENIMFLDIKKNYAYKLLAKEAHLDENNKLISGSILEKPKIVPTSQLGVKTDSIPLTKKILEQLLKIGLDRDITPDERLKKSIIVINNCKNIFDSNAAEFLLEDISFPVKWGKKKYIEYAMRAYNAIVENTFEYMSSGRFIYCKYNNLQRLKNLKTHIPLDKLSGICVPYKYNVDEVKETFHQYGIEIDYDKQWDKVITKTVQRVIELFKNEAKKYQEEK